MLKLIAPAAAGIALFAAVPALADDSLQNASIVIGQASQTTALLAESGLKATAGVVAVPIGLAGMSAAAGGSAALTVAEGANATAEALSNGTEGAARFAREPLRVDADIVVRAQPAPRVPHHPQAARR